MHRHPGLVPEAFAARSSRTASHTTLDPIIAARSLFFGVISAGLIGLAACASRTSPPGGELAAPPGSMASALNVGADGNVYMSWLELREGGHALRFAVFGENGWSEPRTVAQGEDWFASWADWPSVTALENGVIAAHWLVASRGVPYAYDIELAFSDDGGKSWSAPVTPHDDGTVTEHGFVSTLPVGSRLELVWLDGRQFDPEAQTDPLLQAMSLRHATLDGEGNIIASSEVDARVCDCCGTSAVQVAGGMLVAYRDRSEDEIRDIAVRRFADGRWSEAVRVHDDNWRIDGCPINGPALAAQGSTVAAAWFTGEGDRPRVLLAFSSDGGAGFKAPVRIDEGRPLGRVDVALLPGGDAIVSWVERTLQGAELKLRRVRVDGSAGASMTLGPVSATGGFPHLERRGEHLVVAWTADAEEPGRVRAITFAAQALQAGH